MFARLLFILTLTTFALWIFDRIRARIEDFTEDHLRNE